MLNVKDPLIYSIICFKKSSLIPITTPVTKFKMKSEPMFCNEFKKHICNGNNICTEKLTTLMNSYNEFTLNTIKYDNKKFPYDVLFHSFDKIKDIEKSKLQKKLNISDSKWFNRIENLGKTVSATIPIAINILQNENKFSPSNKYLMMGIGVGLSVAGCIGS